MTINAIPLSLNCGPDGVGYLPLPSVSRDTYYIEPNGSDANSGSRSLPWLSFDHAFSTMASGDELILLDGTYSDSTGQGIMRDADSNGNPITDSTNIPSGVSLAHPTLVRAENLGGATVQSSTGMAAISMGRSFRKDSYIHVEGIFFVGGGQLYNTSYNTLKNCGFHGSLSISPSGDHNNGNSYNLIEDFWVYASDRRIIAMNYQSHNNVWRRGIVRSDGCVLPGCEGYPKTDPSVGITVYDSHDCSMQNIIVVDRLLTNDVNYGDFATAQHTSDIQYHMGRNEWLGCMSINSNDMGFHFEADSIIASSLATYIWKLENCVAVGSSRGGISIGNTPYNYTAMGEPDSQIDNATIVLANANADTSAIRVSPQQHNVDTSACLTVGATRTGHNEVGCAVSDSTAYNPLATEGDFDVSSCSQCHSLVADPLSDSSLLYPVRVEAASAVATAISGVSPGAEVLYKYGVDGARYGDTNFNTLSINSLWPWPNEDQIKAKLGTDASITRGFCSTGNQLDGVTEITLTSYIWESLGNQMPTGIY